MSAQPYDPIRFGLSPKTQREVEMSTLRNSVSKTKSLFDALKLRLNVGDIIRYKGAGGTLEFAYSAIWRGLVKKGDRAASIADFVSSQELLPIARFDPPKPGRAQREKISPAEMLLGFVEIISKQAEEKSAPAPQALSFAGKLRFSDATTTQTIHPQTRIPLKILASPKPPSPALYFTPHTATAKGYLAKRDLSPDKHRINGQKRYLHAWQANGTVTKLDANGYPRKHPADGLLPWQAAPFPPDKDTHQPKDDHPKQRIHAELLPPKSAFTFTIDFDNLSQDELELLCFSLRPTDAFRHKLGMGKPIGLGSVRLDVTALKRVDRIARYASDGLTALRDKKLDQNAAELARCYLHDPQRGSHAAKLALRLLGDPAGVSAPVHYPQIMGHNIEDKTYQWFFENDGVGEKHDSGHALKPLAPDAAALPTLKRMRKG